MAAAALLALLSLYGALLYLRAPSSLWPQGAILAAATLLMEFFWKPSAAHDLYRAAQRKNASAGWPCAMLLLPMLSLAAVAPDWAGLPQLHGLLVVLALAQAAAASVFSPALVLGLGAATAAFLAGPFGLSAPALARSALSAAVLQAALLVGLPGTFSAGEASLLAQLVVGTKFLWAAADAGAAWTGLQRLAYAAWLASALAVMLSTSLSMVLPVARSPLLLLASLALTAFGTARVLGLGAEDCLAELLAAVAAPGASTVLGIWATGLVAVLLCSWLFYTTDLEKGEEEEAGKLQVFRKTYHVLALLMFLPAGLYNLPLTQFGLVLAICAFVQLEALRILMPHSWLGGHVADFVALLSTDDEAKGRAVIPHFFLLLGCALPILISTTANSIHAYAGVFALCITDASAAIAGSLFGEHKWSPAGKKTVEGTLVALVATYIFTSFISELIAFEQPMPELPSILAFSLALPVWEAVSDQNDNLTLPIVAFAVSSLVF